MESVIGEPLVTVYTRRWLSATGQERSSS